MYFVADAAEFWTPVETQLLCELVSAITWQALRIMSALITALSFLSSWSHSAKFIAGLYNFFLNTYDFSPHGEIRLWNCRLWKNEISGSLSHPSAVHLSLNSVCTLAIPTYFKGTNFWGRSDSVNHKGKTSLFFSVPSRKSVSLQDKKYSVYICWGEEVSGYSSSCKSWVMKSESKSFFFSSGFTWTSVKKEQSPLLWKKPWLFDEMAAVNDRMKSVWPLCVKNLTDSYRRFLKVPEKELLSISHICRCYTSCSHSLAPCGCYWLFLTTVL